MTLKSAAETACENRNEAITAAAVAVPLAHSGLRRGEVRRDHGIEISVFILHLFFLMGVVSSFLVPEM